MKNGFSETLRINTLSCIPPYDRSHSEDYSYISVGHINERYGILNEDGTILVPFEYDNITVWGFGLLQLSLKGKLGLLHIRKSDDRYNVVKLINCEFDVIDGRHEGVVFLRKYGLRTDNYDGRSVRAYLTKPEILTDEYTVSEIISSRHNRGMISLGKGGREIIVDAETGGTILEMDKGFTLGGYETKNATVLQQDINGGSRLIRIIKGEIESFEFDGMSACAICGINQDGDPDSVGFIIECSDGFRVLDDELVPMDDGVFTQIATCCEMLAIDRSGKARIFNTRSQKLRLGDLD